MKHPFNISVVTLPLAFLHIVLTQPAGAVPPGETKFLEGVYHIRFGMGETEVIQSLSGNTGARPVRTVDRENTRILEFERMNVPAGRIDKMRVFVNLEEGVFWIEEQLFLRWDSQGPHGETVRRHQNKMAAVTARLRKLYGPETLLEPVDPGVRSEGRDFVAASWSFPDDRWIHVIYEPQDRPISPQIDKIIIIYRDSKRDRRIR